MNLLSSCLMEVKQHTQPIAQRVRIQVEFYGTYTVSMALTQRFLTPKTFLEGECYCSREFCLA